MRWLYLSPHFDDVVFSCGGLICEQVQSGVPVEIWTVCAGEPDPGAPLSEFAQSLHQRWQTGTEAVDSRRSEDEAAAACLGAATRYWDLPDCIYRPLPGGGWLVNGEDDLWQPVHPLETGVIDRMVAWLSAGLSTSDALVSPLSLGNHVDHRLVRAAAEQAARKVGCGLWFYADYPYAVQMDTEWAKLIPNDMPKVCWPVSRPALSAWQTAASAYKTQISTFWGSLAEMRVALEQYLRSGGGSCLWGQPSGKEK
jgi:LmbE family N-acetylglucosaminyl deacetylase